MREGTSALAEAHRKAGQDQEHSSKALQAQQVATHSAQQQLQTAQVIPVADSPHDLCICCCKTGLSFVVARTCCLAIVGLTKLILS